MTFRTFVRPLFVALSLAFATTAAAPAFADSPADAKPAPAKEEKGKAEHKKADKADNKKGHKKALRLGALEKFPMKAEQFQKIVDKRIEHVKSKVEAALKKHNVSDADKANVMKAVDEGAASVRAAAKKAEADGTVTKEEAQAVRDLAKKIREDARTKLTQKKSPAAKDV
ncbi:MAG: hypothetical protein U0441_06700 [Polyangiaceae bacterium]